MSGLVVDSIDVFYGPVQAVRQVSMFVEPEERVALLGSNGAGKTTTLRAVSGLMRPKNGTITFDGERIDGAPAWSVVGKGVAHLPEGRDLFRELSVLENLKMGHWPSRRDRKDLKARLEFVMDHFPILGERAGQPAGTLSGGEQQMLGVARSLMSAPRLLLIDELSLGLAPQVVERIFSILAEINKIGTSVLLVEQFVHMALAHTDRAYVLARGEVVLEGRSQELARDPGLVATYLGGEMPEQSPARPIARATTARSGSSPRRRPGSQPKPRRPVRRGSAR